MDNLITQATNYLEKGGIVSLPTETVYSLSVNASIPTAVDKIYDLKGRDKDKPLALLVGSIKQARNIVKFNDYAEILANKFFPGPLTLILEKKINTNICENVNKGLDTIAVRMPDSAMTLSILKNVDFPVIGTSANPSGHSPANNAAQVKEYFKDKIDMVIDTGNSKIGTASTIIDLSSDSPKLLRQGIVTASDIEKILNIKII